MADQRRDLEQRPSPEALLAEARREEKGRVGRLKIFVGAAPGVGKTYEMLQAARAKLKEGVDVVVGVVETHGRKETEALLEGFEVIPRKPTVYVNRILNEFDIDAALKRRPALILVDELAHTNIPGSRHPKRYQDVEELLDAGIDVYTTVNIQHIESLNDVVAQITRVRVREIVPDAILDRADAIELVDLTPDDLIQRLKEGKVYVPKQAERALKHYFSPANLTALRELALRRTAERVDEQLLEHMQARAISGPWAAGERILVCVSEDPRSAGLVRYAKRLADRLHAPWTALYVETRRSLQLSEEEQDRIAQTSAAGRTPRRRGHHDARRGAAHRRRRARASRTRTTSRTSSSASRRARAGSRSCMARSCTTSCAAPATSASTSSPARTPAPEPLTTKVAPSPPRHSPSIRSPTSLPCWPWPLRSASASWSSPCFGLENVDLIFLTAIVGVAVRYGLWPSLLATVAASLSYNFFFLPPVYTFTITDPTNIAAFVLFTVIAVVVSNLAARGWSQTVGAQERVRSVESLYAFSRKLAGAGTLDDVLWATAYQIASMLKVRVVLLLPENGSIALKAGYPPEDTLDEADLAAAKWAWEKNRPAGRDSDALPGAKWLFMPMRTGRGQIGILGICRDEPGPLLRAEQRRLLGCAQRPGCAGDRARSSRRGHRAGAAGGRDRPLALGPADVDLARPQDPARGRSRRSRGVARSFQVLR